MKIFMRYSILKSIFLFKSFLLLLFTTLTVDTAMAQETLDFRNPTIINGGTNLAVGTNIVFRT